MGFSPQNLHPSFGGFPLEIPQHHRTHGGVSSHGADATGGYVHKGLGLSQDFLRKNQAQLQWKELDFSPTSGQQFGCW